MTRTPVPRAAMILAFSFAVAAIGLAPAQAAVAPRSTTTWVQDPVCLTPPYPPDPVSPVVYEHFADGSSNDLTLDVYRAAGSEPHPSLIVIHGGSWKSGCKGQISKFSERFRDSGFTVFSIAYRTDCKKRKPPATLDDPTYCKGVGQPYETDDVATAVAWVRANAQNYGGDPTRVATFGDSSAGNVAFWEAANRSMANPLDPAVPDVVTAWSGNPELRVYENGETICPSSDLTCNGAARGYVGCSETGCPPEWDYWSPYGQASVNMPPTFIGNGTTEVVPIRSASEWNGRLALFSVIRQLCAVPSTGADHGLSLADQKCGDASAGSDPPSLAGTKTYDATVAFILANM